jgi:hypothetical protein
MPLVSPARRSDDPLTSPLDLLSRAPDGSREKRQEGISFLLID